ncbi:MAG: AAA family ATPase [Spiribacter salinus]|uniref:AAA family ATPase n=1 Tax=Spiribacter salinus TaxID=1335746 RepID=A0A540VGL6_9GAMM|nr:MAG: AAA family ATPase [Spiribacter salinus]
MTNSQNLSDSMDTKTETRQCDKHGEFEAELFRIMDKWHGGLCPRCDEERVKAEAERKRREELAEKQRKVERLMGDSGIPRRFQDRTLDSYRAETEGQKRALQIARKMAGGNPDDGVSLVFCGKPGTGKTHLACGIAHEWIETGIPALFATVLAAIRHIKSTYNRESEITEEQAISVFTRTELLILDEIGVQLGTEHEKMLLFEIINERYQQMRPTILISNLTRSELTDYLGDRVMDRFRESGAVVAFDWDSYRGGKS